jgi:thymidylate synthase
MERWSFTFKQLGDNRMSFQMLPYEERSADTQYRDRLKQILEEGDLIQTTPQDVGALTCFGTLPPMIFDLKNGAPLITERSLKSFWRKPIAELLAFINGVRTQEELEKWGCSWWNQWATPEKAQKHGLKVGDLGPGSYGAAFHDFPIPDGGVFNQFAHLVEQLKKYPYIRTHLVNPWIPYYIGRGGYQKALVSPCHGWLHFRVFGNELDMIMTQRSADMPVGVPSNMIQYTALLLAVAHVTGYTPRRFIHELHDAHIYTDQVDNVRELLIRESKTLPTMSLVEPPDDLFAFRPEHFSISDYNPHPSMPGIAVAT